MRRTKLAPAVDLMPLIDVVFLLLTFFIFALVLTVPVRITDVSLPGVQAGGSRAQGGFALLALTEAGEVRLDEETIALERLGGALTERQDEAGQDLRIVIAVDREATVGDQFELLDALEAAGFTDFRFLRDPRRD